MSSGNHRRGNKSRNTKQKKETERQKLAEAQAQFARQLAEPRKPIDIFADQIQKMHDALKTSALSIPDIRQAPMHICPRMTFASCSQVVLRRAGNIYQTYERK